jgi:hypothetical protein
MGNIFKQCIYNPVTPPYNPHLVATWAEIPPLAGKRYKKIFPAFIAVYAAEPVLQQTTVQILIDSLMYDWTQRSVTIFIPLFVFPAKLLKMILN